MCLSGQNTKTIFLYSTVDLVSVENGAYAVNIPKAGHHRPTSETPLKWRFAAGSMEARDSKLAGSWSQWRPSIAQNNLI